MLDMGEVITAMVTPFDKNYNVDFESCGKLMDYLINEGTDGILLSGSTGECSTLSDEEKLELFRFAKNNFGDRVKIIAGTGSNDTKHSIELSKEAERIGVDCLLIVAPYYNKPSQQGIYRHFEAIAAEVNIPIILYNVPSRTVSNISSKTCVELSKIDNICGVKEASGDMRQISEIIRDSENDFVVYSGNDGDTLPVLSLGGYGIISVASHIICREIKQMISSFKKGDYTRAAKIHLEMLDIFNGIFIAPNPVPIKEALNMAGISVGPCRLPLCSMEEKELETFREILKKHKII
ncbi:MAG: 4-hydroxy-tetrahydrodipicolinate synthase [Candidatus Humimicrobiaceae bacterium]|jgi:4-hydroxy-tetrahydrodipicolinate synthase|nr:4-hydroxy-tetrahydrodipicolinate synthase [Actinomycetota bacterium]MDY0027458.1 4-hydroxy-tetrahydrodipicolinate synthase [Candidatus Humimicrobiaceae bacterium]